MHDTYRKAPGLRLQISAIHVIGEVSEPAPYLDIVLVTVINSDNVRLRNRDIRLIIKFLIFSYDLITDSAHVRKSSRIFIRGHSCFFRNRCFRGLCGFRGYRHCRCGNSAHQYNYTGDQHCNFVIHLIIFHFLYSFSVPLIVEPDFLSGHYFSLFLYTA